MRKYGLRKRQENALNSCGTFDNDSIFKAFNLILVDSNSDSDIKDNIFKIKLKGIKNGK